MSFPLRPSYSKSQINRAGEALVAYPLGDTRYDQAREIVNEWRVAHAYPINTFNSTLRDKVVKFKEPIVAQRLKRLPTIIDKLSRQEGMKLSRMQDIGGVRAVVNTIEEVRELQSQYVDSKRFSHKLVDVDDYIDNPKPDGYRGVHLIYSYHNTLARNGLASGYEGLLVELQLRTKLQHTWATAVETVGTFLGQALKSDKGESEWLEFFALTSAVFSHKEKTTCLAQYSDLELHEIVERLAALAEKMKFLDQIEGLSIAADAIQSRNMGGFYNLIVLNVEKKTVQIKGYRKDQLRQASADLAALEKEHTEGAKIDPVLVSAGRLKSLKKAYPNYFLDIGDFVKMISDLVKEAQKKV